MSVQYSSTDKLETGRKIGALIQDTTERARLVADPQAVLSGIGVNTAAKIYADSADTVHLVIPAQVDETRVAAEDAAYFEELGLLALGLCMYAEQSDDPLT